MFTVCFGKGGWGGRIRTLECQDQNLVPCRLATPHRCVGTQLLSRNTGSPVVITRRVSCLNFTSESTKKLKFLVNPSLIATACPSACESGRCTLLAALSGPPGLTRHEGPLAEVCNPAPFHMYATILFQGRFASITPLVGSPDHLLYTVASCHQSHPRSKS